MALEVLIDKDVTHDTYHDLESVFYILCWICTRQGGFYGVKRNEVDPNFNRENSIMTRWMPRTEEELSSVGSRKGLDVIMLKYFETNVLDQLHYKFDPLKDCLQDLRDLLFSEHTATAKDVGRVRASWNLGPREWLLPNGEHIDSEERRRLPPREREIYGLLDDFEQILSNTLDRLPKIPDSPPSKVSSRSSSNADHLVPSAATPSADVLARPTNAAVPPTGAESLEEPTRRRSTRLIIKEKEKNDKKRAREEDALADASASSVDGRRGSGWQSNSLNLPDASGTSSHSEQSSLNKRRRK